MRDIEFIRGDMKNFLVRLTSVLFIVFILIAVDVDANNLNISNVSLGFRDPSAKTVVVQFDINWENSWRNKINHDAVWLTVRLNNSAVNPPVKNLCNMNVAGLNAEGTSVGSNSNLEIFIPADIKGAFLRRATYNSLGSVASQNVQLKIKYDSCGFSDNDQIFASIFGVEMVLVPQGFFYAGDNGASAASFQQGTSDNEPWSIQSENTIQVSNSVSNGNYYVSNNNIREDATGAVFAIGENFPKGFKAFYSMKYEITEGQWVEFINSLGNNAARLNRDLSNSSHKNSDSVVFRNSISCAGEPLVCVSQRPSRAVNFLNWMDLAAFLDWNALRPMTELEFEKIARGPFIPLNGEYAWGTTEITAVNVLSNTNEDGSEVVTTINANAHFNDITLTGGDSQLGVQSQKGPLRVGIFATPSSVRISAGASYYGVMEISGNLKEQVVSVGNVFGRSFTGEHGDGNLTGASGFEGNANVSNWPGMDEVEVKGITNVLGSGFRGGSWQDASFKLRVSDRTEAVNISTEASPAIGGRGVRTYDGN